jgi:hypothetical protein
VRDSNEAGATYRFHEKVITTDSAILLTVTTGTDLSSACLKKCERKGVIRI